VIIIIIIIIMHQQLLMNKGKLPWHRSALQRYRIIKAGEHRSIVDLLPRRSRSGRGGLHQ
jgi:hypothetical protein